jgi:phospholipase C
MKVFVALICLMFAIQVFAGYYSSPSSADQSTTTPIKHVVVIMMENHSFDNIFGLYPTMNRTSPGLLMTSLEAPDDVLDVTKSVASTLSQVPNGTYETVNPDESVYYRDWDNGKMDGFASNSGTQAMTYFSSSQLAIEWDWAEEYAIGDKYFSSCLCETIPNRLFSLAGYSAGETQDFSPPPYIPVNQSIFSELNHYGVSWAYYVEDATSDNFPLNYFDGISTYSSQIQSWDNFSVSLEQGTLPSVSSVMPVGGGAYGVDQHPSSNVTEGEDWLLGVVNSVMTSSYWNSTAIFVTYDEGGGYYDHISPPVIDGVQLGFRVPFFVISPYAKENYVSHTVMNHGSILAFIDYNWELPALNQFVADSALPLDMFSFNESYPSGTQTRSPVVLSATSDFPMSPQIPFTQLPYARQGLTTETLSSSGGSLYVMSSSTTPPFYESLPFELTVAIFFVGAIVAFAIRSGWTRRRPFS